MPPNKHDDIVVKIVVNAIKEGRKPKKSINPTSKTTFKKLAHTGLLYNVDSSPPFAPIITFKTINTCVKLSTLSEPA